MSNLIQVVDAMLFTEETYEALKRYYSLLRHTGYRPDSDVDRMLMMVFIEEILYGEFSEYVTDEDYKYLDKAIQCLYGTCMMPFPAYKKGIQDTVRRSTGRFRSTERGKLRGTGTHLRIES